MRGIPAAAIFMFIGVILLVELLAYLGLIQLVSGKRTRRIFSGVYALITICFVSVWLTAFLNPEKIRQTVNYDFFYFVISLTVLNLVPKSLLAVSTVVSAPLRLFPNKYPAMVLLLSGTIISLGMLLSISYGVVAGKRSLQTNRVTIYPEGLPEKLDGLRVVQISDLHLGSFNNDGLLQRMARQIDELKPDLLLFTGDMVNNYYQEMAGFENALSTMKASKGKFAIFGNHDYGDYSNWKNEAEKEENHRIVGDKIKAAGFVLLQNQSAKVLAKDTCLYLIGVENWGHKPFPQYADMSKAMAGVPDQSFKILMSHDPAHWADEIVPNTTIPLTLAGHTHGGQFGFKLGGITFSPMYLVQKLWAGIYERDRQLLYVNQGTGCVGFPGRIDMNPEITLLILRSDRSKIN